MIKKTLICATMLGIVVLALASSGGGRKKGSAPASSFTAIRSTGGFSLKSQPSYTGSMVFSSQNHKQYTLFNSVVTYQKGNTIYVIPSKHKINMASRMSFKSNLNAIDLKLRLCK